MSTKTLRKRIALVAVSALGFGVLASLPANAASAGAVTSWNVAATGITATSAVAATSGEAAVYTRVGQTITINTLVADDRAAGDMWRVAQITGTTASTAPDALFCADTALDAASATTTCSFTVTAAMNGKVFRVQIKPSAGTYSVLTDLGVTLNVVNAGAPASVTFAQTSVTEVSASAVDYTVNATPKDANGVSTILLDNETISIDVSPNTGSAATQVGVTDASKSEAEPTAAGATSYAVVLEGDGGAGPAGTTIGGTEYVITAQLLSGTSAIGSTASTKYKRLANTSTLTGTVVFTSDTTGTALSSLTLSPSIASSNFYVKAVDANGGLIKGATVALTASAGTVDAASRNTDGTGYTAAWTTTQSVAGAATLTARITTGATSISSTLTTTTTAFGATLGTNAGWAVKNNNGSGVKAGTAPAWTAAPNVTSFAVTISGLDASKAAKITVAGDASTSAPKVNGVTGSIYPVADANGVITVTVTAAGSNNETATLALDADNAGGAETTLTITYATATGAITTSPAASSLNMATPSSTNAISASVADQYGNILTGGSVTITNTTVPAGVTAATAATVLTGASNTATVNAVVGATLGQYVFSIQAKDANGSNVGSASTVTYQVTATGIAGSLTLADNDTIATGVTQSDNISTRAIDIAPSALSATGGASTSNIVAITVTTATPAALTFSATATNGIRLFTTDPGSAAIAAGKSTVTGTAGTTTIYAVPTLVGAGTITVTSGGLTQVFTLTGKLDAAAKAQLVTLTAGTNANGKAAYTVKTTDIYGNAVAADVNITMSGNGYLSNGFKNMTVSTLATDGSNSFDVISDGTAASGVTATVVAGSFQAITATEATAQSLASASVQSATGSVTVVQREVPLKSAELLAIEAIAAKAAADKAESDAKIAALEAQIAANKAATDAAIAAAQAAAVAASEAAADAAAEAIDAGNNAFDAATSAGEAADAATAAAEQAGEDATAAATAAGEAAVAAAEAAQEAAAEATDAANAATDAANASAEAADAATAAAQDAADAVAALSTQVSEMVSALKKQITALTNLVIKIQKKVKA
jgi:trimeric autotransporter adhesin